MNGDFEREVVNNLVIRQACRLTEWLAVSLVEIANTISVTYMLVDTLDVECDLRKDKQMKGITIKFTKVSENLA